MCDHGHSEHGELAALDMNLRYSLYQKIDMEQVTCLNELVENSGKSVFRPWDERFNRQKCVISDTDSELLFNVPFTGTVRLKGIIVIGGAGNTHPDKLRLFKNKHQMSFDDTVAEPEQVLELTHDRLGVVEYPLKVVKFNNVTSLGLHFTNSNDSDMSILNYIGLRGDFLSTNREQIVICTYEARAMPQDHKSSIPEVSRSELS